MISFKASYIKPITITNKSQRDFPVKEEVALVKLDSSSLADLEAVDSTSSHWGYYETYAHDIKSTMSKEYYLPGVRKNSQKEFFAATLQKENFQNLDSKKIIGLMQIDQTNPSACKLDFIQVSPELMNNSKISNFKNIGKAMIEGLKRLTQKNIELNSIGSAGEFYKKLGFEKIKDSTTYVFRRI